MKPLRIAALAALLWLATSCAETTIKLATPGDKTHPGHGASARIASDVDDGVLVLTDHRAEFRWRRLNNSAPTAARGDNILKAGKAGAQVGAVAATKFIAPH